MSGEVSNSQQNQTSAGHATQHEASTDGINLLQGESVLQNRRPGWSLWWKQIAFAALVLLVGAGGDAAGGAIIISGLIFAYVVISRMQSRYIVTDERVKAKVGILSKMSREYRLNDVQSLSSKQSLFERLFGHGTLTFRTASNDEITWHGVPEYQDVANTVRRIQRQYE
jgi:membrane protein YdbS with pleckstrin-like domain